MAFVRGWARIWKVFFDGLVSEARPGGELVVGDRFEESSFWRAKKTLVEVVDERLLRRDGVRVVGVMGLLVGSFVGFLDGLAVWH